MMSRTQVIDLEAELKQKLHCHFINLVNIRNENSFKEILSFLDEAVNLLEKLLFTQRSHRTNGLPKLVKFFSDQLERYKAKYIEFQREQVDDDDSSF